MSAKPRPSSTSPNPGLDRDQAPRRSLIREVLPGEEENTQAPYPAAAAHGVIVACLYLPYGNPQPGPKFKYKLRWFEHLIKHAESRGTCLHFLGLLQSVSAEKLTATLRINHLLLNLMLTPRLQNAGVDPWVRGEEHASDHAPTRIEIGNPQSSPPKMNRRKAKELGDGHSDTLAAPPAQCSLR